MKKILILLLLIWLLSSCFDTSQVSNTNISTQNTKIVVEKQVQNNLKTVWVEEFKKELEKNDWILIDLRTPSEVSQWVISSKAINYNFYSPNFIDKIKLLDRNKKYLIYCHSWVRSWKTFEFMKKLWFKNVINLKWWINAWINATWKLEKFQGNIFWK